MAHRLSQAAIAAVLAAATWFAMAGDCTRPKLRRPRLDQPGTELLRDADGPRRPDRVLYPEPSAHAAADRSRPILLTKPWRRTNFCIATKPTTRPITARTK